MKKASDLLPLLESYLSDYLPKVKGLSPNTVRSYRHAFRLLFEFLYSMKAVLPEKVGFITLTDGVMVEWLNWLEDARGCSAQTRNQRLSAIASFAHYALREDLESALAFSVEVGQIPRKKTVRADRAVYLTREEMAIVLRTPPSHTKSGRRDAVLMSTLYASGARAQELCDITVGDIRFGNNTTIALRGKGNKSRTVVIPEQCAKLLRRHVGQLDQKWAGTGLRHVFSSQTREHMTIACVEEIVKKHIKKARATRPDLFPHDYSPHSFRHSVATHMLESGVPLPAIKAFLGHASISTTMVYAATSPELVARYLREKNPYAQQADMDEDGQPDYSVPPFLM
ncbi:MAG: site-specific integrase [Coriobacteriales bacterium]|jgi:site-specific recombinase XerD|nr:site-specific integrase [Coriobacteriales bacterium]